MLIFYHYSTFLALLRVENPTWTHDDILIRWYRLLAFVMLMVTGKSTGYVHIYFL